MSSFSCPFREPKERIDLSDTIAHIIDKVCSRKFKKMSQRIMNASLIDSIIYIQYLYLVNSKMINCILQFLHWNFFDIVLIFLELEHEIDHYAYLKCLVSNHGNLIEHNAAIVIATKIKRKSIFSLDQEVVKFIYIKLFKIQKIKMFSLGKYLLRH